MEDGTCVFDVQYKDGEDEFTLDSGAGVNMWRRGPSHDAEAEWLTHVCRQWHRDPELGPQDRAVLEREGRRRSEQFVGFHRAGVKRRLQEFRRNDHKLFFRRACMNTL